MNKELRKIIKKIAKKSDPRAFRELFNLYNDRLLKIAQYFIKSEVLAEEITADVFVSIWKNRARLLTVEKLDYYLFTSVKRKCIDSIRKSKSNMTIPMDLKHEQTVKTDVYPDTEMLYKEFETVVINSIGLLPPKTQLIYKMVKEDDMKYKEVSDILEISDKVVEYHIGQAFKKIRQNINKYQNNEDRVNYMHKLAMFTGVLFCQTMML